MNDEEATGPAALRRAVWRAVCLSCGKSSEYFPTRDDARRWREQHRLENDFPSDIVIEALFRRPGGTDLRTFEHE
jgi:hypothetical protein